MQLTKPGLESNLRSLGHEVEALLNLEHQLVECGVEAGGVLEFQRRRARLGGRAILWW